MRVRYDSHIRIQMGARARAPRPAQPPENAALLEEEVVLVCMKGVPARQRWGGRCSPSVPLPLPLPLSPSLSLPLLPPLGLSLSEAEGAPAGRAATRECYNPHPTCVVLICVPVTSRTRPIFG